MYAWGFRKEECALLPTSRRRQTEAAKGELRSSAFFTARLDAPKSTRHESHLALVWNLDPNKSECSLLVNTTKYPRF